jgi:hypothetical protein
VIPSGILQEENGCNMEWNRPGPMPGFQMPLLTCLQGGLVKNIGPTKDVMMSNSGSPW